MSEKRVAAVILAAGSSSRMGSPKQLLEIEGQTLLHHAVATALACLGHAHVVLGYRAPEIQKTLNDLPVSALLAPNWAQGLSASVKAAVASIETQFPPCDAILFLPCDLPLLSSGHLNAIVAAYRNCDAPLVVSQWDDVLGIPALFDRVLWPEFETLAGDEGARKIIRRHKEEALQIPFSGGRFDLDTSQQVENFLSQYPSGLTVEQG